jgi:membrane protein required for beta-lactamase induction
MLLLVVLLALGVQRFLSFVPIPFQMDWFSVYYHWYVKQFKFITQGHALFGLSMLAVPLLMLVSLFFSLIYHVFGELGYWVVSAVLLWYCLDAREYPQPEMAPLQSLSLSYVNIFALIFWFALFGPVGLALYYIVYTISTFKCVTEGLVSQSIIRYAEKVLHILDWVPLRLFILTLAFVQNFARMFGVWCRVCLSGLSQPTALIEQCVSDEIKTQRDAVLVTTRALIVWLALILLVTFVQLLP